MTKFRRSMMLFFVFIFIGSLSYAQSYYVDCSSGSNTNNTGLTQGDPFETIDHAFDQIQSHGWTVYVAPGLYNENLIWPSFQSIKLFGSLNPNDTIINGAYNGSVIVMPDNNYTLDDQIFGFKLINGSGFNDPNHGYSGGGIYGEGSSSGGYGPLLRGLIFEENLVTGFGGGLYCGDNFDAQLENVEFNINSAGDGGAMYCHNSSPRWISGKAAHNVANGDLGGAVVCDGNSTSIPRIEIMRVYMYCNNVTSGGTGGSGCIHARHGSNVYLENVTIANNMASTYGGGIGIDEASTVTLLNTILWENMPYEICFFDGNSALTANYCDINGGFSPQSVYNPAGSSVTESNNVNCDPEFVDPNCGSSNPDFSLLPGSCCINTGTQQLGWNSSLGNWHYGANPEIGAYEFSGVGANDQLIEDKLVRIWNYPNPFNPQTTIHYDLLRSGYFSLKIYDIRGKLVKTLMNDFKDAGNYEAIWNGKNNAGQEVSSGIYLYNIKSQNFNETKSMLLLK